MSTTAYVSASKGIAPSGGFVNVPGFKVPAMTEEMGSSLYEIGEARGEIVSCMTKIRDRDKREQTNVRTLQRHRDNKSH